MSNITLKKFGSFIMGNIPSKTKLSIVRTVGKLGTPNCTNVSDTLLYL